MVLKLIISKTKSDDKMFVNKSVTMCSVSLENSCGFIKNNCFMLSIFMRFYSKSSKFWGQKMFEIFRDLGISNLVLGKNSSRFKGPKGLQ